MMKQWLPVLYGGGALATLAVLSNITPSAEAESLRSNRREGPTLPPNNPFYTEADAQRVISYVVGRITLTPEEFTHLDYNKDGRITAGDAQRIRIWIRDNKRPGERRYI